MLTSATSATIQIAKKYRLGGGEIQGRGVGGFWRNCCFVYFRWFWGGIQPEKQKRKFANPLQDNKLPSYMTLYQVSH